MVILAGPSITPGDVMPEYPAFTLGDDGHFVGFEPIACASDDEALEWAKRLSGGHAAELWSGTRLVGRLSGALQQSSTTHEIHQGAWLENQRSSIRDFA